MDEIAQFVADLSTAVIGTTVNPYRSDHQVVTLDQPDAAVARRTNLYEYLQSRTRPRLMLVGEAPGYRGCRFSGIAFTSERSLPIGRWSSLHPSGWREASATIVHGALADTRLEEQTVLWNAVPHHPAGPHSLSNRTPTRQELVVGLEWLERLVAILQPQLIVAIGRSAKSLLPEAVMLRHPANGGASLFRQGLAELAQTMEER